MVIRTYMVIGLKEFVILYTIMSYSPQYKKPPHYEAVRPFCIKMEIDGGSLVLNILTDTQLDTPCYTPFEWHMGMNLVDYLIDNNEVDRIGKCILHNLHSDIEAYTNADLDQSGEDHLDDYIWEYC